MCNLLFLLLLTLPTLGYTQNKLSNEELFRLSSSTEWLALLHYKQHAVFKRNNSYIVNNEFFLHPNGKFDPEAELEATISAFDEPVKAGADTHASCVFPARKLWIEANSNADFNDQVCEPLILVQ